MRRHWPFAGVLAAATALRVVAAVNHWPALLYSDSLGYISMSHGPGLVTFAPLRPSGYPLLLSIIPGELASTTVLQHLAGLATGALVYALLVRLGTNRRLAAAAAAVVLLDAWAISLEQHILAEAFFALAITAAAAITLWRPAPGALELAAAGLLLAGAALMRPVALAAAGAWLLWIVRLRPPGRIAAAGVAALALPLVVYALGHASATGTFGLTQADGWFLYGRVGEIAGCGELGRRRLCTRTPAEGPNFYIFNRRSPARREFRRFDGRSNRVMREFALDVIRERPGEYARIVARDFLKYFRPGPRSRDREDSTIEFGTRGGSSGYPFEAFHTSRVLIAVLTLLSLAALALRRLDKRRAGAVGLTLGMSVAMLVAASMTAGFALRYLVPGVAILIASGTLSAQALGRVRGVRAES